MSRPKIRLSGIDLDEEPIENALPDSWRKGQLLNVHNTGVDYVITLYGESYDSRYPERAMRFANSTQANDFLARWYAREHSDPRAG